MSKDAPGASVAPKTTAAPAAAKGEAKPKADAKPKGPRKPRVDYGYKPGAKITVNKEHDGSKYRGKRLEYFDHLKASDGKTVEDFAKACPAGDPPRGWLRFLVQDGAATLSGGKDPEPKVKAAPKADAKAA